MDRVADFPRWRGNAVSPTVGHAACAEKLQHPTLRRREEPPGVHLGQYEGTDCRYATTNLMRRSSLPSPTRRLLQRMKTWLPRPPSPAPVIVCSEPAVTDMAPAPSNEHVAPAPAVTSAVRAWLIESSPTRRLLHQMNTLLQHRLSPLQHEFQWSSMRRPSLPSPTRRLLQRANTWLQHLTSPLLYEPQWSSMRRHPYLLHVPSLNELTPSVAGSNPDQSPSTSPDSPGSYRTLVVSWRIAPWGQARKPRPRQRPCQVSHRWREGWLHWVLAGGRSLPTPHDLPSASCRHAGTDRSVKKKKQHQHHSRNSAWAWLGLAVSQSFLQLSPPLLAMTLLVEWLSWFSLTLVSHRIEASWRWPTPRGSLWCMSMRVCRMDSHWLDCTSSAGWGTTTRTRDCWLEWRCC